MRRLVLLALIAGLVLPALAAAEPIDGFGRYYMFRTLDTGQPPNADAMRRCRETIGAPRNAQIPLELDAALYGFRVDQGTGRLVDETTAKIGPGYICGVASTQGSTFDTYAQTTLPETGLSELTGPCDLQPVAAQPGAAFFNCRLTIMPNPATGILGGVAVSNSVVNPKNAVPGNPTGSAWTAYVLQERRPGDADEAPAGGAVPGLLDTAPAPSPGSFGGAGAHFFVARSFEATTIDDPSRCVAAAAQRESTLSTFQPSIATGELLADSSYSQIGNVSLCYLGDGAQGVRPVTATVQLAYGLERLDVRAAGTCRPTTLAGAGEMESCSLSVSPSPVDDVKGGLLTSLGLVDGDGTSPANAHVWSVAVLRGFAP